MCTYFDVTRRNRLENSRVNTSEPFEFDKRISHVNCFFLTAVTNFPKVKQNLEWNQAILKRVCHIRVDHRNSPALIMEISRSIKNSIVNPKAIQTKWKPIESLKSQMIWHHFCWTSYEFLLIRRSKYIFCFEAHICVVIRRWIFFKENFGINFKQSILFGIFITLYDWNQMPQPNRVTLIDARSVQNTNSINIRSMSVALCVISVCVRTLVLRQSVGIASCSSADIFNLSIGCEFYQF